MIALNDASGIEPAIRQSVLKSKDILSGDAAPEFGQNVFMTEADKSASDFKRMFIARTAHAREQSGRSQERMAADLGIGQATYHKYETRTPLPHHLVVAFCALCEVTPAWLYTAAIEFQAAKPRRKRAQRVAERVERGWRAAR